MLTKLTLRLEAGLVRRAKSFAKKRGKSVSRLVADCFTILEQTQKRAEAPPWPPLVRALKGSLAKSLPEKQWKAPQARQL